MMERVECRNCECSQPSAATCRRCGRPLPAYKAPESDDAAAETEALSVEKPKNTEPIERVLIVAGDAAQTWAQIERTIILARIAHFRGNIPRAAQSLGLGKTTLYRKLREYADNAKAAQRS